MPLFLVTFSAAYGKQINFPLCGLTISRLCRANGKDLAAGIQIMQALKHKWSCSTSRGERWRQRSSRQIESRNETPLPSPICGAANRICGALSVRELISHRKLTNGPYRIWKIIAKWKRVVSFDEDQWAMKKRPVAIINYFVWYINLSLLVYSSTNQYAKTVLRIVIFFAGIRKPIKESFLRMTW